MSKGGFLTNTPLQTKLQLTFDNKLKQLSVPLQEIIVQKDKLKVSAEFNFSEDNRKYAVDISASAMPFQNARLLLSKHIATKLDSITVTQPLNVEASIRGRMRYPDTPVVNVSFAGKNTSLQIANIEFDKATFSARYSNELEKIANHSDQNSVVFIDQFSKIGKGVDG